MGGERLPVYGKPKLFMAITRSADVNKTPDVRTRAILPEWACKIRCTFVTPYLAEKTVATLLSAAGLIQGVGDWRPQKGSGNFGQFIIVNDDDPAFLRVIENGGRAAQLEAMEAATPYDQETEELMEWFKEEADTRSMVITA